jgi:hypothetical protein
MFSASPRRAHHACLSRAQVHLPALAMSARATRVCVRAWATTAHLTTESTTAIVDARSRNVHGARSQRAQAARHRRRRAAPGLAMMAPPAKLSGPVEPLLIPSLFLSIFLPFPAAGKSRLQAPRPSFPRCPPVDWDGGGMGVVEGKKQPPWEAACRAVRGGAARGGAAVVTLLCRCTPSIKLILVSHACC